jgi:hypothetical protein
MKSGIFDKNGEEVKEGDILIFPYVDPMGNVHEDSDAFEAEVKFRHGCFGYETETRFMPLFIWSKCETEEYIPNHGEKLTILDEYPFRIKK